MAAKYNVYAVARGVDKATGAPVTNMLFKTWEETKPYINGVEKARYKGFMTEEEANLWLAKVSAEEVAAPAAIATVNSHDAEIEKICKQMGITRCILRERLEKRFIAEWTAMKPILGIGEDDA